MFLSRGDRVKMIKNQLLVLAYFKGKPIYRVAKNMGRPYVRIYNDFEKEIDPEAADLSLLEDYREELGYESVETMIEDLKTLELDPCLKIYLREYQKTGYSLDNILNEQKERGRICRAAERSIAKFAGKATEYISTPREDKYKVVQQALEYLHFDKYMKEAGVSRLLNHAGKVLMEVDV